MPPMARRTVTKFTPEEQARETLDHKLNAAGWVVQDFEQLNLGGDPGAFSAEELEMLACQRLFAVPFFDGAAFRGSLGGEQPLTCR